MGHILGRKNLTYSDGVRMFLQYYGPGKTPISAIWGSAAAEVLPTLAEKMFRYDFLIENDTEAKFEAALLKEDEPDPVELEVLLKEIGNSLPRLGKTLTTRVKRFPHQRGGRPEKISSPEDQLRVIDEIKELRGPGSNLDDLFKRVGRRHGVSGAKIKQIWSKQGTPRTTKEAQTELQ